MEAQRALLGGDAEHSVLVKGLDFALLARRKAELEAEKAGDAEEELDELAATLGKVEPKSRKSEAPAEKPKASKVGVVNCPADITVQNTGAEKGRSSSSSSSRSGSDLRPLGRTAPKEEEAENQVS